MQNNGKKIVGILAIQGDFGLHAKMLDCIGVPWKLVGIVFDPEALAGEAAAFGRRRLLHAGNAVGATTVVVYSPRLKSAIGYARIDSRYAEPGTELEIEGSQGRRKARVAKIPFFDARKAIARQ